MLRLVHVVREVGSSVIPILLQFQFLAKKLSAILYGLC
mgnify:CR=1 FL=1|jgi:hypothetical protein